MEELQLKKILAGMSLRQKICQLFQLAAACYDDDFEPNFTGPMRALKVDGTIRNLTGSIIGEYTPEKTMQTQQQCYDANDKIPVLIMLDVIHGYRTIFPIPLALACTWNEKMVFDASRVAAKEARVSGVHVTFAPMADLVRDARWGRVMESSGEDPHLNAVMAGATVRGFQGDGVDTEDSLVSCMKHFAAYGAAEGGRDYNTVDMSRGILRDQYLSGYKAAVDAGCDMAMTAFNVVERVPATCNRFLLQQVLRQEWGFDGVVISDWNSIDELIAHSVAEDGCEAATKALSAGVDIDMMSGHYIFSLEHAIEKDPTLENCVNESVLRILRLKNKMGLFEDPTRGTDPEKAKRIVMCEENRSTACKVAEGSVVLLKNEDVLPVDSGTELVLAGSFARSKELLGAWACRGETVDCVSLEEGLRASAVLVTTPDSGEGYIQRCCAAAKKASLTILACGEPSQDTGEATSKTSLRLSSDDTLLLDALAEQGSKVVLVVFSGRPLVLSNAEPLCAGIVQAWFPGTEAGNALANIITGKTNPSGRLAISFPRAEGQLPMYYNHYATGRPLLDTEPNEHYVSKYIDCANTPLYPFGFGLSYTGYEYNALTLSSNAIGKNDTLSVSVMVKNTGKRSGVETVQLYIRDYSGSIARPVQELKAFCQVKLAPGQQEKIVLKLSAEDLSFWDNDEMQRTEAGRFRVMVGSHSQHYLAQDFTFTEDVCFDQKNKTKAIRSGI